MHTCLIYFYHIIFHFIILVNCVDRHMKADPDRCALIWEKDEPGDVERVTYRYFERNLTKFSIDKRKR